MALLSVVSCVGGYVHSRVDDYVQSCVGGYAHFCVGGYVRSCVGGYVHSCAGGCVPEGGMTGENLADPGEVGGPVMPILESCSVITPCGHYAQYSPSHLSWALMHCSNKKDFMVVHCSHTCLEFNKIKTAHMYMA